MDGVVFLPSFHEAIKDFPDAERLLMYDAIIRYGLFGETIELPPVEKSMFALIKPIIDSSQNRHRASKENGKKGGRPKNQTKNQKENQTKNQTQNQDIDIDYDIDSEKDSDFETDKARADTPTLEEVIDYCYETDSGVNPERFYNYYAARGWKTGNTAITNWKALLRSWKEPKEKTAAEWGIKYAN